MSRLVARRKTLDTVAYHDTFSSTINNTGESSEESDDDSRQPSPLRNCKGGGGKGCRENKPILLSARLTCAENTHVLEWKAKNDDVEANNNNNHKNNDESALLDEVKF